MAEVGVLDLQIHDNSAKAAEGLNSLASALERVRNAVGGIRSLGSIATQLEKINVSVRNASTGGTIENLNGLASALKRVKEASEGIQLPNFKFSTKTGKLDIEDSLERARASVRNSQGEFSNVESHIEKSSDGASEFAGRMERVNEIVKSTAWSAGGMEEAFSRAFAAWSKLRSSSSLGSGAKTARLGAGTSETGWQWYNPFGETNETGWDEWKNGAIDAEYSISDATENISNRLQETNGFFLEAGDTVDDVDKAFAETVAKAQQLADGTSEIAENIQQIPDINNATDGFIEMKNAIEETNGALEEERERLKEARAEALKAADQVRLENNYPQYRELYMSGMSPWTSQVPEMYGFSGEVIEKAETYAEAMRMVAEEAERVQEAIEATASVFQGMMNVPRIGGGQSPLLLGSGGVPQENALSTWVDFSEQWKPDWTGGENFKPDWIFGDGTVTESVNAANAIQEATETVKESAETVSPSMESMGQAIEGSGEKSALCVNKLKDLDRELKEKKKDADNAKSAFDSFKEGMSNLLGPVSSLVNSFARMAKYRMMRAIIKEIAAGFKEGVENLYQYSNAVGTSFAPAMDSAASTMLQFKNSIGAAVAPAIEALIPVLQTVVDWMITAINYVNQFLALISGKGGWTKAVPAAASAFDEASKKAKGAGGSAKKAAKDVKELLADWDELNIIQSQTGSGGGGGGGGGGAGTGLGSEFASMFEEVRGFDKEVQAFVKNLKDEFGSVLGFVTEIGAAVLAWKVSSVFGGIIGTLAGIAGTAIALDLVIKTTGVFDKTFLDTGSEGWLIGSILTPVIGGIFAKQILSKVISGSAGKLAIPLMLTVSSVVDVVTLAGRTDVSALDKKSLELSVVSALKAGGAAAYFAHTLGGYSLGGSIAGGAAVAIATFGVAIGIKAIAQTVASGVTMENVKAAALASLAVGLGAGMFAKIAGATLASAAVFGGAAAAITVGTLAVGIGIAALINASKDKIKWGTEKLTEEQIENFVNSEMFSIDVKTTAKIITDNVVAPSQQERAAMEESLSTMLGDWKIIKLGVAEKQDYENLETDVNNLVTQIGTYIDTAKKAGKLTIQFVPTLAGESEEEQTSWLSDYTKGWKTVDDWATNTGKRLGELISKAETNSLKEGEPELLETLMGQMSRVTAAIARGKAGSEAFGNLIAGVGDIDQASFDGIIKKYKEYQTDLRTSLTAQANEQLAMQGSLVAALYEIDPNGAEYKRAKADYEKMAANLVASIEASVKTYSSDGANWLLGILRDKYAEYIPDIADGIDIDGYFASSFTKNAMEGKSSEELANYIDTWISNLVDRSNSELSSYLDSAGIANWNILETNVRESIKSAMEAALGPELTDEIIKMWEINNPVEEAISNAEEPQVETAATVDATVKENVSYETVSEATEAGKGAVGDLPASVAQELADTDTTISTHTFPATSTIDTSATTESARQMRDDVAAYVNDTIAALETLNSISGGFSYGGGGRTLGGGGRITMTTRATGGNIRSGEAFFANENGTIEMMGKMGNSAVVANNQQIVEGISRGVAASNSGMESSMNMMVALMRQFVSKEFTAKVVPSSSMGRNNAMSAEAYRKVTG